MDTPTLTKVAQKVASNLDFAEVIGLVRDFQGGYWVAWVREGDHVHNYGTHAVIVQQGKPVTLVAGNYIKTEAEAVGDALRRARLDVGAQIHQIMDGVEWSPDTLDEIAQVLERAGYEIRDPNDEPEPGVGKECKHDDESDIVTAIICEACGETLKAWGV